MRYVCIHIYIRMMYVCIHIYIHMMYVSNYINRTMYVCMYVVRCMYAFTYIHECMFDRRRRSPTVGQSMVDVCLKTKRDDVCLIVEDEERGCMKSQSMVSVCLIAKDEER